jgi:hypothetical protein
VRVGSVCVLMRWGVIGYQDHKVFFNGCKQEDILNSTRNGISGILLPSISFHFL